MPHFTIHTLESAPDAAKPFMEQSLAKYKGIPNLHAIMAESPQLFEAYRVVTELYRACSLNIIERQVVMLTINLVNSCSYCMAAHSTLAQREKMPAEILAALRAGGPLPDPRLQALAQFTRAMVEKRGWLTEEDFAGLFAAGYGKQQALDVVLAVGYKTMANYTNHFAETPLDAMFANQAWSPPREQVAE